MYARKIEPRPIEVKVLRDATPHDLEEHRRQGWEYKHIQFDADARLHVLLERVIEVETDPPPAKRSPFAVGIHTPASGTLVRVIDETALPRRGTIERQQHDAAQSVAIVPYTEPAPLPYNARPVPLSTSILRQFGTGTITEYRNIDGTAWRWNETDRLMQFFGTDKRGKSRWIADSDATITRLFVSTFKERLSCPTS